MTVASESILRRERERVYPVSDIGGYFICGPKLLNVRNQIASKYIHSSEKTEKSMHAKKNLAKLYIKLGG